MSDTNPEWIQEPLPGMPTEEELGEQYVEDRQRRTLQLRHDNAGLLQELRQLGGVIDAGAVSQLQLQALMDVLLTEDQQAELTLLFEQRIRVALLQSVTALRRQKLTEPLQQPVRTEFHRDPRDPKRGGAFIGPA